jgi:hypothetical protein
VIRLIQQRQVHLGKINDLDVEPVVLTSPPSEPLSHSRPHPTRTRAADDDLQQGLGHSRNSHPREPTNKVIVPRDGCDLVRVQDHGAQPE